MIEIQPATFQVTPYGEVDAIALDRLRASFDTSQVLRLVDRLDACLAELGGVVAVRDELLTLHAVALTIVDSSALTVPSEHACIWSEAEALQQDLETLSEWVRSAQAGIAPLVNLAPIMNTLCLKGRRGNTEREVSRGHSSPQRNEGPNEKEHQTPCR
ncbi:hypothetical protein GCM10017655_50390 [Pseudomonas turukhanskensis]|jgi:hypothetical protein|uniref:Transposase n=1 Tax=Pseudomonas turukhanskensis TaxID=1806536 RepID=A0A9W6NII6_9PSED|nr:hypothetical protein GCM10017655_50390 [Pseudomonas turukhanskensis]